MANSQQQTRRGRIAGFFRALAPKWTKQSRGMNTKRSSIDSGYKRAPATLLSHSTNGTWRRETSVDIGIDVNIANAGKRSTSSAMTTEVSSGGRLENAAGPSLNQAARETTTVEFDDPKVSGQGIGNQSGKASVADVGAGNIETKRCSTEDARKFEPIAKVDSSVLVGEKFRSIGAKSVGDAAERHIVRAVGPWFGLKSVMIAVILIGIVTPVSASSTKELAKQTANKAFDTVVKHPIGAAVVLAILCCFCCCWKIKESLDQQIQETTAAPEPPAIEPAPPTVELAPPAIEENKDKPKPKADEKKSKAAKKKKSPKTREETDENGMDKKRKKRKKSKKRRRCDQRQERQKIEAKELEEGKRRMKNCVLFVLTYTRCLLI